MVRHGAVSVSPFSLARFLPTQGEAPAWLCLSYRRVVLQPHQIRNWQVWADLRRQSQAFLTPWEPSWGQDDLTQAAYRRRLSIYKRDWRDGRAYSFLIWREANGDLLGGLSINNVRRGIVQSANLGYWIGQPYAGQGYMGEALIAGLKFCFEHLKLHRVEAACLLNNEASHKVLLASGFRLEGLARSYLKINGRWQDHRTFAVLFPDVAERLREAHIEKNQ